MVGCGLVLKIVYFSSYCCCQLIASSFENLSFFETIQLPINAILTSGIIKAKPCFHFIFLIDLFMKIIPKSEHAIAKEKL